MDEKMEDVKQTKKSIMPLIAGVIVILLLAGAFIFIKSNGTNEMAEKEEQSTGTMEESTNSMMKEESSNQAEGSAMMEEGKVNEIAVEAGSFYYKPNVITVKKGEKVRIVMNSVSMMHDFNIDELGVKLPIVKNGETGTVEFVADKVGTFEYYCSVGNHRAQGQVGTITIE